MEFEYIYIPTRQPIIPNETENKKGKNIFIIIGMTLLLIGTTYTYFKLTHNQNQHES